MADMQQRQLGDSEIRASVIGLGCNNFGREGFPTEGLAATERVLKTALDNEITFFDTAALYGGPDSLSETLMGQALRGRRDEAVIATKFGHTGEPDRGWGPRGSQEYVRRSCEASLRRLQTDRIDLYQMHEFDESTPIAETLGALAELVAEQKVLAIGASNFTAAQLRDADLVARDHGYPRFVSVQNEYSLLHREPEAEVLPACAELDLGFLPYFPLKSGLLTGKYRRGEAAPAGTRLEKVPSRLEGVNWDQLEAFEQLTRERGLSMTEATFAWLLAQPAVTSVIAGATSPEQVEANAAAGRVRLDADTVAAISEIFA